MKCYGGKRTLPNAEEVSTVLGVMCGAMTRAQIKEGVRLKDAKVDAAIRALEARGKIVMVDAERWARV